MGQVGVDEQQLGQPQLGGTIERQKGCGSVIEHVLHLWQVPVF